MVECPQCDDGGDVRTYQTTSYPNESSLVCHDCAMRFVSTPVGTTILGPVPELLDEVDDAE